MKKYVFKPYNPIFTALFAREKKRIIAHVQNILCIEHVGSTAIPNLGGKGIIDIAISTNENTFDSFSKQIQVLGYEFRPLWSNSNRLFFRTDLPDQEERLRRYHIHLVSTASKDWKDMLSFRDYLRLHPEVAQKYAVLKKAACESVHDLGEHYRVLKAPFIEDILIKKTIY